MRITFKLKGDEEPVSPGSVTYNPITHTLSFYNKRGRLASEVELHDFDFTLHSEIYPGPEERPSATQALLTLSRVFDLFNATKRSNNE